MKKSKQLSLFTDSIRPQKFFGGALLEGRRKSMRPLTSKDSIHFVLRSSWAMGSDSFLAQRNRQKIDQIISRFAKKFGVRIYERAINSNHLHLLLRMTNRRLYRAFIKAVSGQIASQVMGQKSFLDFSRSRRNSVRGDGPKALSAVPTSTITERKKSTVKAGFWQFRPFSRVVNWGRDFKMCVSYLKQNVLEAFGFVPYKPRKNPYAAWIKHVAPKINTG
jgi:REP element-mobilizing transposase RayT